MRTRRTPASAALSRDGELVAIEHSEHGDSRHVALRVLRVADGSTVADLWDGPGLGLEAVAFAPIPGDTRMIARHERLGPLDAVHLGRRERH